MKNIKIALTGESGYIASQLKKKLWPEGAVYMPLGRDDSDVAWLSVLEQADVVINLAGAPVIQRWTVKNRQTIKNSRVETTRRLVSLLNQLSAEKAPKLLISGSAIGIYPDKGEKVMTENDYETGEGFLSQVVQQWEYEANQLNNSITRLVNMRIGVVLGLEGGLLRQILPLFKRGLGGTIASGRQAMSFVHIDDLVAAVQFFIENKHTKGIYNMVAPHWVSNQYFTKTLLQGLNKPGIFTIPAWALRILYGAAANIMINGEKVYPERLLNEGFEFNFPTIESALDDLIEGASPLKTESNN